MNTWLVIGIAFFCFWFGYLLCAALTRGKAADAWADGYFIGALKTRHDFEQAGDTEPVIIE